MWRHCAPNRPPLSGAGARAFGGRWNPPGVAAIYLATPRACCIAELERSLADQARGAVSFPRSVHEVQVAQIPCVDLSSEEALDIVGLSVDDLIDSDWSACQHVGNAVHYLGIASLLAPSATQTGNVLTVFEPHLRPGQLEISATSQIERPPL